jgi:GntR family transcriptional regulator, rspAB operon transcriptional repressor
MSTESDVDGSIRSVAKPESLTDSVYDAIREAIVNRAIKPGARLTEAGLAQQLGVSKTPVREALLKLRQIGLIEPAGRRGGRVTTPSLTSIRHAYETREALETQAAALAARRAPAEAIQKITDAADACLAHALDGDLAGFRHWDGVFHQELAEACGNPQLLELVEDALARIVTLRRRDVPQAEASVDCARAHVEIAKAVAARDADAAFVAMRAHVRQVEGYVLASLDDGDEGR